MNNGQRLSSAQRASRLPCGGGEGGCASATPLCRQHVHQGAAMIVGGQPDLLMFRAPALADMLNKRVAHATALGASWRW